MLRGHVHRPRAPYVDYPLAHRLCRARHRRGGSARSAPRLRRSRAGKRPRQPRPRRPSRTLTISGNGSGNGTVTSSPAGINCTITDGVAAATGCSAQFTSGVTVTLTAKAKSGSSFVGWLGACTGLVTLPAGDESEPRGRPHDSSRVRSPSRSRAAAAGRGADGCGARPGCHPPSTARSPRAPPRRRDAPPRTRPARSSP